MIQHDNCVTCSNVLIAKDFYCQKSIAYNTTKTKLIAYHYKNKINSLKIKQRLESYHLFDEQINHVDNVCMQVCREICRPFYTIPYNVYGKTCTLCCK